MLPSTTDGKTQEVITVLSDDLAIRLWTQEVRDQNDVTNLPEETQKWVKEVDWLDDLEIDAVDWNTVVEFLLDNIS
ncbi:MAG: hypothetical protein AAFU54_19095 [Chloroflexota bacterium]